jgi:hypothetical protein
MNIETIVRFTLAVGSTCGLYFVVLALASGLGRLVDAVIKRTGRSPISRPLISFVDTIATVIIYAMIIAWLMVMVLVVLPWAANFQL